MADADGIKYHKTEKGTQRQVYGYTFEIPCEVCGKIYEQRVYKSDDRHVCQDCRKMDKKQDGMVKQAILDKLYTTGQQRFFKAQELYRQQAKDKKNVDRAIAVAKKACEKFGSVPEAMVGIELIRLGYRVIPQCKIGQYRVDFAIPDEKLIIEVDGSLYHSDKTKSLQRDAAIEYVVGFDWAIAHIPAELIQKDITKLKACIDSTLQHRRKKSCYNSYRENR